MVAKDETIDRLRAAGIEVLAQPSGTHFLKLTGTPVVANDSASEIPDQDPSEMGDSKENEAERFDRNPRLRA